MANNNEDRPDVWEDDQDQSPVEYKSDLLPETSVLAFASWVLVGILTLAILSGVAFVWLGNGEDSAGALIFDTAKTILPPMATLVLTYYFAKRT